MRKTFNRCCRISSTSEIKKILFKGRRYTDSLANFYFAHNSGKRARLCVIISKECGNACLRNRIKRCFREAFRLNREHLIEGTDIIVKVKSNIRDFTYQDANQAFLSLCKKAGVLKDE